MHHAVERGMRAMGMPQGCEPTSKELEVTVHNVMRQVGDYGKKVEKAEVLLEGIVTVSLIRQLAHHLINYHGYMISEVRPLRAKQQSRITMDKVEGRGTKKRS